MTGETFAAMLRRLRIAAGLSQNELARQAGCDPAYVNQMERAGERTRSGRALRDVVPRRTVVLALAEVLDVSQTQADRLLYAAGLAPQQDWQTRAARAEYALATIRQAIDDAGGAEQEPTPLRVRTG